MRVALLATGLLLLGGGVGVTILLAAVKLERRRDRTERPPIALCVRTRRMTRADIDRWADQTGEEVLFADGFDDAILGVAQRFNSWFVVYDRARVIQTLIDRDEMDEEDAVEFFDFNIVGAWVGEGTPAFLVRTFED